MKSIDQMVKGNKRGNVKCKLVEMIPGEKIKDRNVRLTARFYYVKLVKRI